jgi:predicted nucleic acid-binding protein
MIIDASVAIPWLLETPFSNSARRIRPKNPVAPSILLVETANVLMKYTRLFGLPFARVHNSLEELNALFSELVEDRRLLRHAIDISAAHRHKVYDCLYLALALERGESLATADRRLASLAQALGIETTLIEPEAA